MASMIPFAERVRLGRWFGIVTTCEKSHRVEGNTVIVPVTAYSATARTRRGAIRKALKYAAKTRDQA